MLIFYCILICLVIILLLLTNRECLEVNRHVTVRFYYVDWCGYCHEMRRVWDAVKKNIHGVKFEEINETNTVNPASYKYPTILKINKKGKTTEYIGPADFKLLYNFVVS